MEPVPETESLEEFRSSPVPTLRLQESSFFESRSSDQTIKVQKKPPTIRSFTDPSPPSPRSPGLASPLPYRARNTSPYSRGHLRSKSSTSPLAPPMSRAQSLPGFNAGGHLLTSPQRPSSPLGSPSRVRAPRKPADEIFPGLPTRNLRDISESGDTDSAEHTPRAMERSSSPILALPPSGSYTRARRSASPLRHLVQQNSSAYSTAPTTPSSVNSSPSYQSSKFNDSFLGTSNYSGTYGYPGSYSSSSVPSTPTSVRSRSPSISSLETIPDSPDAEEAALEGERIAQLKAAADAADRGEENIDKGGVEGSGGRGRTLGVGFGSRDKRKRWSVCGAERRGDLNLDTIWED